MLYMNNDLFSELFNDMTGRRHYGNALTTDILEDKENYIITIDVPGIKKENVQLQLKDGYLTVTASTDSADENTRYIRSERFSGSAKRSFYVGNKLLQEDINAKLADGVLTLTFTKNPNHPELEDNRFISISD